MNTNQPAQIELKGRDTVLIPGQLYKIKNIKYNDGLEDITAKFIGFEDEFKDGSVMLAEFEKGFFLDMDFFTPEYKEVTAL